ncbi:recombinase family protein [Croceicoccus marinus]|uniref:recombinase family protein n=1 Tax=Croceicoccus marinus TaxID=450378 RepID=UPI001E465654|nr:recombinase family protein [Croceicoccus marinus]
MKDEYDDGGLSGGTLERPALQRLLADIEAGTIDIVVVYKVDRLTRSLLDFSKLVETFDANDTSFVSVTQSFNTTTSMRRLTLNMLLSFAQFEREVTAERIRDKIAASKAKGMWMGGNPPLGYRPEGRSLAIVEEHARVVRHVFDRYLALGNVREVTAELDDQGIIVPERFATTGRKSGGIPFTRGQLYRLLSNPIYIGRIAHNGTSYDGRHDAIVAPDIWKAVQAKFADQRQGEEAGKRIRNASLLAGRIQDEQGQPLVATHAVKKAQSYRYYVSRALQHAPGHDDPNGMRIPALEIEAAVINMLAGAIDDPLALLTSAALPLESDRLPAMLATANTTATLIRRRHHKTIRSLIAAVTIAARQVSITISVPALCTALGVDTNPTAKVEVELTEPMRLTRTGRALKLVQRDGRTITQGEPDQGLIELLTKARNWWTQLQDGRTDIATIARSEKINDSWVSRIVRLNFLAPQLTEAILAGTQPTSVNAISLRSAELPIDWDEQLAMFKL